MKFQYGEYEGTPFQGPDALFPEPKLVQFILQHGEQALEAMEQLGENEEGQEYLDALIEAGLLEKVEDEEGKGKFQLTPRMVKGMQHKALLEIFDNLNRGTKEGHETRNPGRTSERSDGTKPYEFGDPLSEVDFNATLRNAMARQLVEQARRGETPAEQAGPSLPIHINPNDFELHVTEGTADCATVILIDQSGSMMRWGRFYQAKRVALGMAGLIQQRFPQDTLDFVGFYSLAERIRERDLPLVMPKPISVRDYQVRLRLPLDQAREHEDQIPLHFTNLQLGLRQARQILSRRGAMNKQIFVITDGQPTAHVEPNAGLADHTAPGDDGGVKGDTPPGGEMLYLLYPPNERTTTATLKEALKCQQQGIRIATFALIEDYWGMDWVGFVDRLTRLTRGMAYYCTSDDLSSTVIESYFAGRKKKSFIH